MNDYIQLRINLSPCSEDATDLMAAYLCDEGYESFVADEIGITAFIPEANYDRSRVESVIENFPMECDARFSIEKVEGRDWNEEWEKHYFQPIIIGGECVVHSSFHKNVPQAKHHILIDPKMAFGTGHHSTTSLMMRYLLDMDLADKDIIDMGTGTGILAILAKMTGCRKATGIEIDEAAWENATDNCRLNNIEAKMIHGDASCLTASGKADIFLANINRNIILNDMPAYVEALKPEGFMILSGFYEHDLPMITGKASDCGMILKDYKIDHEWVAVRFAKS